MDGLEIIRNQEVQVQSLTGGDSPAMNTNHHQVMHGENSVLAEPGFTNGLPPQVPQPLGRHESLIQPRLVERNQSYDTARSDSTATIVPTRNQSPSPEAICQVASAIVELDEISSIDSFSILGEDEEDENQFNAFKLLDLLGEYVVKHQVTNPSSPLLCLQGLDLKEKFQKDIHLDMAALVTPTMRDVGTFHHLTLSALSFLFLLCDSSVLPGIDNETRTSLVALHLNIDIRFARYLIFAVKEERNEEKPAVVVTVEGRTRMKMTHGPVQVGYQRYVSALDDEEEIMEFMQWPTCLRNFARFHQVMLRGLGMLRIHFLPQFREARLLSIESLGSKLEISEPFTTFIFDQCIQNLPESWY
jgi:hypothetical protein